MKKISQGTVMAIPFPTQLALDTQRRIAVYLDGLQAEVDRLNTLQARSAPNSTPSCLRSSTKPSRGCYDLAEAD